MSIFHRYAGELQVQEFSQRCLAAPLFERKHDAIDLFAGRNLLKISGRADNAGIDQRLANVLSILVEKAHNFKVELGPVENFTNQRNSEGARAYDKHTLLSRKEKIGFKQHQAPT